MEKVDHNNSKRTAALRKVVIFLKNSLRPAILGFLPAGPLFSVGRSDSYTLRENLEAVYLAETKTLTIPALEKEMIGYLANRVMEEKYKEKLLKLYRDKDLFDGSVPESTEIISLLLDQDEPADFRLNKNEAKEAPVSSFRFAPGVNPVLLKNYVEVALRLAAIAHEYEANLLFIESGLQCYRNGEKIDHINNDMLSCIEPVVISLLPLSQEVLGKETVDILTSNKVVTELIKGEFLLPEMDTAQDFMQKTFSEK